MSEGTFENDSVGYPIMFSVILYRWPESTLAEAAGMNMGARQTCHFSKPFYQVLIHLQFWFILLTTSYSFSSDDVWLMLVHLLSCRKGVSIIVKMIVIFYLTPEEEINHSVVEFLFVQYVQAKENSDMTLNFNPSYTESKGFFLICFYNGLLPNILIKMKQ